MRRDGLVVSGSEVGLVDLDPREVIECGKVGPGEVLVVDTRRGEVIRNLDAKREVAGAAALRALGGALHGDARARSRAGAARPPRARPSPGAQRSFGYGFEDLRLVLEPMGGTGADPVWSMGDDTPIPPLSAVPQSLYAYFRQRFAQVTNPPIDSLREAMVMSLRMHLGRRGLAAARAAELRPDAPAGAPGAAARGDGGAPERRRILDRHAGRGVGHDPRHRRPPARRSPRSAGPPSGRRAGARTS